MGDTTSEAEKAASGENGSAARVATANDMQTEIPNTIPTPDLSAMHHPALLRLPTELLFLVAGFLNPWVRSSRDGRSSDLCNLRLVSRQLNQVALPALAERYFRNRCIMLQRNSLENLVAIARHPVFGPAVVNLTIRLSHWTSSPRRAKRGGRPQEAIGVEEADVDMDAYHRLMEDQLFMMESGLTVAYLVQSLAALPALKTVYVNARSTPWGSADLMRQTGLRLDNVFKLRESISFAKHAIRAIVLAIIASNTSLEDLTLWAAVDDSHTLRLDMLPYSPSVLRLAQSHPPQLTALSIVIRPSNRLRGFMVDNRVSHFLQFFALFPRLEHLSLEVNPPEHERSVFRLLAQGLRLQGLQSLYLAGVQCTAGELLGLLRAHKDSLRELELEMVDVVAGNGEGWRVVLTAIRDEALIQTLDMSGCSEEGQDVGYREPGSGGSVTRGILQVSNSRLPGSLSWTTMINGLFIGDEDEEDSDGDEEDQDGDEEDQDGDQIENEEDENGDEEDQ